MFASIASLRAARGAGQAFLRPSVERLEERLCMAIDPMTVGEQHLHELLNWARANPSAAAEHFKIDLNQGLPAGTITTAAKPPLARNELLRTAITAHLQYLQKNNLFGHIGSNNSTYKQRIGMRGIPPIAISAKTSHFGGYPRDRCRKYVKSRRTWWTVVQESLASLELHGPQIP